MERFLRFHRDEAGLWGRPSEMGNGEINAFLTHLAVDGQVAASNQKQAFSALLFLFREVLQTEFAFQKQEGFDKWDYGHRDFSTLIQGVQGNDVYFLYGNFAYETQLRGFNSYRDILNRWTPTNPSNTIPKVSVDDRNGNRRISTRFLEDGSYLRIRNITLGYNFKDLVGWKGVSSLRLFGTVQNAITLTKYPGMDPEIQANANDTRGLGLSSDLAVGIDWGTIPAPRIWTLGVQMQF